MRSALEALLQELTGYLRTAGHYVFLRKLFFLPSKQNVMMAINIYLNFMTAV